MTHALRVPSATTSATPPATLALDERIAGLIAERGPLTLYQLAELTGAPLRAVARVLVPTSSRFMRPASLAGWVLRD